MRNIVMKMKLLFATLLACCLFLPLSQCTMTSTVSTTTPEVKSEKTTIVQQYAFRDAKDPSSWLAGFALLAPLGLVVMARRAKRPTLFAALTALSSLLAIYCVLSVTFFAHILFGGYLALSAALALLAVVLFEWSSRWWRRPQDARRIVGTFT